MGLRQIHLGQGSQFYPQHQDFPQLVWAPWFWKELDDIGQGNQNIHSQVERPAPTVELSPNLGRIHHLFGIPTLSLRLQPLAGAHWGSAQMRGDSEGSVRGQPIAQPGGDTELFRLACSSAQHLVSAEALSHSTYPPDQGKKGPFSRDIQQPLAIHGVQDSRRIEVLGQVGTLSLVWGTNLALPGGADIGNPRAVGGPSRGHSSLCPTHSGEVIQASGGRTALSELSLLIIL